MRPLAKTVLAAAACFALVQDGVIAVDFASLADFKFEPGMKLPEHVTKLDKKKVRLTGFMMRDGGGDGPVEYFLLVSDQCGCEGMPFLNEVVFCDLESGKSTEVLPGLVTVEGTLFVGEVVDEGTTTSLYNLDVDRIGVDGHGN